MATSSYAATNPRLSRDDLYMILALWMERFPDGEQSEDDLYKKVGAVLVLSNDTCYAIDCSRDGVHAVARLIMAHPDELEGSKVFVSRKPCSFCTKLLVQKGVKRVFNLPIEPEYFPMIERSEEAKDRGKSYKSEKACVDNLFKVSPIGDTTFLPEVAEDAVVSVIQKRYGLSEQDSSKEKVKELLESYWNQEWFPKEQKDLPQQSFNDSMKHNVLKKFDDMVKWILTIWVKSGKYSFELPKHEGTDPPLQSFDDSMKGEVHEKLGDMVKWILTILLELEKCSFKLQEPDGADKPNPFNPATDLPLQSFDDSMKREVHKKFENMIKWILIIWMESENCSFKHKEYKRGADEKEEISLDPSEEEEGKQASSSKLQENEGADKLIPGFNPTMNEKETKQAYHFMILAKFLAERTDDPKTGVGAVIINDKDVVGLGWNGFPRKARYGEFARASDKDKGKQEKKYPYIIHAEQNALIMRNAKNIKGGTLFVTKTPCDECTVLLKMQGITTVVLGEEFIEETEMKGISYKQFPDGVKKGKFVCFCLKKKQE